MANTLQDYYNSGDDGSISFSNSTWNAQTFKASSSYDIVSVKVKLYRADGYNPGTITVSIRNTSGGKPTGGDQCSGTTNGDTLTINSSGEWREITFGSAYSLSSGTTYAIVIRSSNALTIAYWRADSSSPTYSDGSRCYSNDSGSSWNEWTAVDFMFETYSSGGLEGTSSAVSDESAIIKFATTGLAGTVEVLSDETVILGFDTIGLIGTISAEAIISGDVDADIAISGTISVTVLLSGDLLYFNLIKPSITTTTKRLVAAGNNIIYYEDI